MPAGRLVNDGLPPAGYPQTVVYLTKPRLSPSFPPALIPLITEPPSATYRARPTPHPAHMAIKQINLASHPAHGQNGLFTKKKIGPNELILPYLGVLHASVLNADGQAPVDEHTDSDYDLSLLRISASDPRNPFPGQHVSIGVDAAKAGNAGRFINDYRGVGTQPNAEFRIGRGDGGELRMEVWSLKCGLAKGDEILVSYGKGWWGARHG